MYNSDNQTIMISSSGFNQTTIDSEEMSKYLDKYIYGETANDQDAYNRRILGDAIGETWEWYSDSAYFVQSPYSWILRGGEYNGTIDNGIFRFGRGKGNSHSHHSFRVVFSAA